MCTMHISTLPPAESFADVLAWDDVPATGLTDADLRALWNSLTDEEYRAFLAAFDRAPDEDDDGPPDEIL